MRLHRFYVSQPLGEEVVIEDVSLIKQWVKVFRYALNDFVILFNGDGNDTTYSLHIIENKRCVLVKESSDASYIPSQKITLFLSLIKKDNFELVAEKATELSVTTIVPILSERSEKKSLNEERLIRIVIEAAEQCGRGDIPHIGKIQKLSDVLATFPNNSSAFLMQMDGKPLHEVKITSITPNEPISFFIGPEGGWSNAEEELFKEHDITSISLGRTVLRAETAAIAALALLGRYS